MGQWGHERGGRAGWHLGTDMEGGIDGVVSMDKGSHLAPSKTHYGSSCWPHGILMVSDLVPAAH